MTKLRTGLVGCGSMGGGVHAPGLASHPRIELSAIADVTPPNLARVGDEQEIPVERRFAEAEDLVALPDLDLVVVATPPWLRKEPVLAALKSGKHVLAEKPLASVPQDAWEMAAAAKRADRVLAMMHNYLFFPEFEAAKTAIDQGVIGEVQTVSANLLCVPDNPGAATFQPGWRRDLGRAGGRDPDGHAAPALCDELAGERAGGRGLGDDPSNRGRPACRLMILRCAT